MMKVAILFCCVAVAIVAARPADNELDKATANDVAVNTVVLADRKADTANKGTSAVNITGLSTGLDPLTGSTPDNNFKPQKAGNMFARFIDDIFQIPIGVLTSVAKLITSPFTQHHKTPETAAQ